MAVQLNTRGASIKVALDALEEGSRLGVESLNPGFERAFVIVTTNSEQETNERYALKLTGIDERGHWIFQLDPGDPVEVTEAVVSGFDLDGSTVVPVQRNGQELHDFLVAEQGPLEVAASGSFSIAIEPWHTAVQVTLGANSTLTEITGLTEGRGIMLFVKNNGSYTLAESATPVYTIGSDALTLSASLTNWLYLQADTDGNIGLRNLGITSAL